MEVVQGGEVFKLKLGDFGEKLEIRGAEVPKGIIAKLALGLVKVDIFGANLHELTVDGGLVGEGDEVEVPALVAVVDGEVIGQLGGFEVPE